MDKKYHIDYCFMKEPLGFGSTMLIQLGRLFCSPGTMINKHAHLNWYELTLVTEGEGIILTNDIPISVKKGDIYFSFPGDFHEIQSSKENPLKYDFFSFHTKNKTLNKDLKRIAASMYHMEQRVFRNELMNSAVSNAISEMSFVQPYQREILSTLFEQVLYYLLRSVSAENPLPKGKHSLSNDELCFQVMHYIDTHIYSMDNLHILSEKFSYNYCYLSSLFKNTTGNTIAHYYQTRRLDAAKLLIDEGKLKISEISERLNYSSLYAFSKAFKHKYGIAPKHYEKATIPHKS